MRLAGRVAIVTGAARGLGASIVRLFHREGARVVLADMREAEGQALASSLGDGTHYTRLDVAIEADWESVISETKTRFGPPSILVNNASIYRTKSIHDTSSADYVEVFRVNELGCFLGMKYCAAAMRDMGAGSIVNIASTAGVEGVGGALPYTASKHAVVGMTKAAALELGQFGIRVNAVCPGAMATPMLAESFRVAADVLERQRLPNSPLRRMGTPDEIAATVLFLASDESSYATGSAFVIDGGITAGMMGGQPD